MLEIAKAKGKLAAQYKFKKGDKIIAFDGFTAEDSLDFLFYDSKSSFTVRLISDGRERTVKVDKAEDESLNLTFKENDKIRTCQNKCLYFLLCRPNGRRYA